MIQTEIFVQNMQVDVTPDLSALLTFCVDDIKDFTARNTNFSKTIVLPGTSRNNAVFGNVFDINNGNFYDPTIPNIGYNYNASVTAQCFIFQKNVQVFKGVIRILEIIIDKGKIEYECAVFGELGGLIDSLSSLRLEDLDFSAYNHNYTESNISSSWYATKGTGYYYPLIDYGNYSTDKHNWDIRTFRPALYVSEYISKIFAQSGYSVNCPLFSTGRFSSLIIPHNRKQLVGNATTLLQMTRTNTAHVVDSGTPYSNNLQFTTVTSSIFTPSLSNSRLTYTGSSPLNLNLSVSIYTGNYVGSATGFTLCAKINGLAVAGTVKVLPVTGNTFTQYYTWSFNVPVTFNMGDYLELNFTSSAVITGATDWITASAGNVSLTSVASVEVPINVGDPIKMNDCIPKNILQVDFLDSIVKLFNLYIYEDPDQPKSVLIKPYPDFFNTNLSNAVDWTYKLNRSKPISIKPMSELTSRYYNFAYTNDSDFYNDQYQKRYNQNYGDFLYDSAFQLTQDSTEMKVIFSGTPLVGYTGEDKVYPTILKRSGTTNIVEENVDSNIRIMQTKVSVGVSSWHMYNGTTSGTGQITTALNTTTVTGTGTSFVSQLTVGSRLYINGVIIGIISNISSNTSLTLTDYPKVAATTIAFTYDLIISTYTDYPYAGHFDDPDAPTNDLNFGATNELYFTIAGGALYVNQFNVYWSPYMSEIIDKDSKLFTAYFYLNDQDIHNLDFSKYVFVDGNLFALNKIEDYNVNTPDCCKVTLLKVIDSNAIATATPISTGGEIYLKYTATGTEGNVLSLGALTYASIIVVFQGNKLLKNVATATNPGEFSFATVRGKITFGEVLEPNQIIQILYTV